MRHLAVAVLVKFVRGWQLMASTWLQPSCRFYPSCSGYAIEALNRHGALAGSYLAARRLVRCGPWCEAGDDPVPSDRPRLFTHITSSSPNNKNT